MSTSVDIWEIEDEEELVSQPAESFPDLNSFTASRSVPWYRRRLDTILFVSFLGMAVGLSFANFDFEEEEDLDFKNMALTMDFGDIAQPKRRSGPRRVVEIDEVFGNQYIKDKDKVVTKEQVNTYYNAQISGAQTPIPGSRSFPKDLSPFDVPEYPPAAQKAGIQGVVPVKVYVSEKGNVLKAMALKKFPMGLHKAAVKFMYKKKYKPSIDFKTKKPVPAVFVRAVQFKLQ